jgi:hypothetical protein
VRRRAAVVLIAANAASFSALLFIHLTKMRHIDRSLVQGPLSAKSESEFCRHLIHTECSMYAKHLEAMELRENAFAVRERAARARRLAVCSARECTAFERLAAMFEARAVGLERRRQQLEAHLWSDRPERQRAS